MMAAGGVSGAFARALESFVAWIRGVLSQLSPSHDTERTTGLRAGTKYHVSLSTDVSSASTHGSCSIMVAIVDQC